MKRRSESERLCCGEKRGFGFDQCGGVSYLCFMSFVCLFKLDQLSKLDSLFVYSFFPNTFQEQHSHQANKKTPFNNPFIHFLILPPTITLSLSFAQRLHLFNFHFPITVTNFNFSNNLFCVIQARLPTI